MRLFNKCKIAGIFLLALFTTSCIELEERIVINPDKSGEYTLKLDMGAIMQSGMDAFSPSEELKNFPQMVEKAIQGVSGISDIKAVSDSKKGVYSVSFHFKNQKVFKQAMLKLVGMKYGFVIPKYMKIGKHRFSKKNIGPLIAKQIQKQEDSPLTQEVMGVDVASIVNVKTIIELPADAKRVKKNDKAVIVKGDPKKVEIKSTMKDIIQGASTGIVVKY